MEGGQWADRGSCFEVSMNNCCQDALTQYTGPEDVGTVLVCPYCGLYLLLTADGWEAKEE